MIFDTMPLTLRSLCLPLFRFAISLLGSPTLKSTGLPRRVPGLRDGTVHPIEKDAEHLDSIIQSQHLGPPECSSTLPPIGLLPTELLVEVLLLSLTSVEENYLGRAAELQCVCDHWRNVIDASPHFWSTIEFGDPNFARTLARSGNVPINIKFLRLAHQDGVFKFLSTVGSQIRRMRSIEVGVHPHLYIIKPYLEEPTPRLESVKLHGLSPPATAMRLAGSSRLRHVSLRNVTLPWQPDVLRNLKTLSITNLSNREVPTLPEFLGILKACPDLEDLILDNLQREMSNEEFGASESIKLPHLKKLAFVGLGCDLINLIRLVEAPSLHSLVIKECAATIPVVAALIPRRPLPSLLTTAMTNAPPEALRISICKTSTYITGLDGRNENIHISLHHGTETTTASWLGLHALPSTVPIHLRLNYTSFTVNIQPILLPTMTCLYMDLPECHLTSVLGALASQSHPGSSSATAVCPNLQAIYLQQSFTEGCISSQTLGDLTKLVDARTLSTSEAALSSVKVYDREGKLFDDKLQTFLNTV